MRWSIAACLLVVVSAAGCGQGRGAPDNADHPGLYESRTTWTTSGGTVHHERFWYADPAGSFRTETGGPRRRSITVYDGAGARMASTFRHSRFVTAFRGSTGFITAEAGGVPLEATSAFLRGTPLPPDINYTASRDGATTLLLVRAGPFRLHVNLTRRTGRVPEGMFRLPRGKVRDTDQELAPGVRPQTPSPSYWFGRGWAGGPPLFTSTDLAGYTADYPSVEVTSTRALVQPPVLGRLRLADGTPAALYTCQIRPDASCRFSFSTGSKTTRHGVSFGMDEFMFVSDLTGPVFGGRVLVVVMTRRTMITLTGPAVTRADARSLAQRLTPI